MSRAAKATLFGTSAMAVGIVWFVHWAQKNEKAVCCPFGPVSPLLLFSPFPNIPCSDASDPPRHESSVNGILRQAMHAGVIRDMEQQRIKKERQADFDMQRALEEEYKKVQSVDGVGGEKGGANG